MEGMKRGNHRVQFVSERNAAAAIKHDIIDVLRKIPVSSNEFHIGDYGVADASISMDVIQAMLEEIRRLYGGDLEISVIYEDTYKNDFNSLFHKLYGPVCEPPSYLGNDSRLFISACATNFYKQCVPSNSMDMVLCFIALHWLSRPVDLNGDVTSDLFLNTMSRDAAKKIAADDWKNFLHCRSRELKKGGHLVCSIPIYDPELLYGNAVSSADGLFTIFNIMLRKYWKEGKISKAAATWRTHREYVACNKHQVAVALISSNTFCIHNANSFRLSSLTRELFRKMEMKKAVLNEYFRTVNEIRQPFDDLTSPIMISGLKLSQLEVKQIECQHKTTWRNRLVKDGIDDREKFAHGMAEMIRVWTQGTMESALATTRRAAEKDDLLDDFYSDLKHNLLDFNPETFNSEYLLAYVFIEKV